jgi:hypothetical protein
MHTSAARQPDETGAMSDEYILEVSNLRQYFPIRSGFLHAGGSGGY